MLLFNLINKNKHIATATLAKSATHETKKKAGVATVAAVAVAKRSDVKNEPLSITCFTPAGNSFKVQADDAQHAAWLKQMNPLPNDVFIEAEAVDFDDRRHCHDCMNLSPGGRCLAAWGGEIKAGKRYKPLDNCPRRCYGFKPKKHEPDQRTGAERWPSLKQVDSISGNK